MVTDAISGEPLIGATIIYGKGKGVVTDLDGNYSFLINQGERNLTISYVGYKPLSKTISVGESSAVYNFKLKTLAYIAIPIPQKFCQLTWTHRFQLP